MEEKVLKEFKTTSLKIFKYVIGCIMASAVILGYIIKTGIYVSVGHMPAIYIMTVIALVCLTVLQIVILFFIIYRIYKLGKNTGIIK